MHTEIFIFKEHWYAINFKMCPKIRQIGGEADRWMDGWTHKDER